MIHITDHAAKRLAERGITERAARRVLSRGEIVSNRLGAYRVRFEDIVVVATFSEDCREAVIVTVWRTP